MRRVVLAATNVAAVLVMASCAPITYYTEEFSSVMVASDHRKFVVLGRQHHYVFDMPSILDKSLNANLRQHLSCSFLGDFHVGEGGNTFGYFRLQLSSDATKADKKEALAMGYQATEAGLVYFSSIVVGKRYSPNRSNDGAAQTLLNQSYRVSVVDSQQANDQMKTLSPVILISGGGFALTNPATLLIAVPVVDLKP